MTLLNKKIYLAAILLIVFVSAVLWQRNHIATPEKMPFDVEMIRSGDLVFRKGRGIFSDIFKKIGDIDSPFSHVGIVYIEGNDVFTIHTEASELTGVGCAKKEQLSKFIDSRNAVTYAFYSIDGLGSASIKQVLKTALKYVNDKIPFDTKFNLRDDDKLYCTELVYKAFKTVGIDLVGKPNMIQVPNFNSLKKIEAIPVGQLLKSELIKLIPTTKRGSE